MSQPVYERTFSGNAAENYERFFVPDIGAPIAEDLIAAAALQPGERVLDVGCGTGVVARMAAGQVGDEGTVSGLDVNPGMLTVARRATPSGIDIDWYESSAEAMPLPDGAFDVVLSQMSLQFMSGKEQALREMRRVLAPNGRLLLNVPGPTPPLFAVFADALAEHISPDVAPFVHQIFSLSDAEELRSLAGKAGFDRIEVSQGDKRLELPPAEDFLWQYIHSTPMADIVARATEEQRDALHGEIRKGWRPFESANGLTIDVGMTTLACRQERRR